MSEEAKTAINAPTINQIPGFNGSKISAAAVIVMLPAHQKDPYHFCAYNKSYAHYETVNCIEAKPSVKTKESVFMVKEFS